MVKSKDYDESDLIDFRHNAITIWSKESRQYFYTDEENPEILTTTLETTLEHGHGENRLYEIDLTEYEEDNIQVAEWTIFCEKCNKDFSVFKISSYGIPIGKLDKLVLDHFNEKHRTPNQ